jgi:predicted fused transcriptional regulator/phosphomethylpyrimidine kinase
MKELEDVKSRRTFTEMATGYKPPVDRTKSAGILAEMIPAKRELEALKKANAEAKAAEEQRVAKLRNDEEEKRKADAKKRFDWNADQEYKLYELKLSLHDNEYEKQIGMINLRYNEEVKKARELGYATSGIEKRRQAEYQLIEKGKMDWEQKQQETTQELMLGFIKNKNDREIAAINLKYDREIQKAKELGMNTDWIEEQRAIALLQAQMGRTGVNPNRPRFDERNFFRYGNGEGASAADYTQVTAKNTEKTTAAAEKTAKAVTDLFNWLRSRPPGSVASLTASGFDV